MHPRIVNGVIAITIISATFIAFSIYFIWYAINYKSNNEPKDPITYAITCYNGGVEIFNSVTKTVPTGFDHTYVFNYTDSAGKKVFITPTCVIAQI